MLEALLARPRDKSAILNITPIDDDGSVSVKDQGSLGLDLTRLTNSTAKVITDANFGKCLSFDGSTGLVSRAVALPINTSFTLSMDIWIRDRRDTALFTHVTWTSGGSSFGIMALASGQLQVYINGSQRLWSSVVPLNTPANVKLVSVNKVFSLYLNDVLQSAAVSVPGFNDVEYRIGVGSAFEGNAGFNGMIKNLLITSP